MLNGNILTSNVGAVDYIVTSVGGSPGVINGATGTSIGTYATYSAAVNAALGATASPINIWLDPRYVDDETGTITISRGRVGIYSGLHNALDNSASWFTGMPPAFQKIQVNSTSAEIRSVYLSGINMRSLDLYANGNSIHNVRVDGCGFWPTTATSTNGVLFNGANMINYCAFNDCWLVDGCTTGGIRFSQTADPGSGQYYFNRLHYKPDVSNTNMVAMDDAARIAQILIFNEMDHVNYSTGHVWFHFHDSSYDKGIRMINSSFEEHKTATIFQIDAGSTTRLQRHQLEFSHNSGTLAGSSDGAGTLSIIQNSAPVADFSTSSMSYLHGHQNRFLSTYASGVMTPGTTGASARFNYDVGYTYYNLLVETNVVATKG